MKTSTEEVKESDSIELLSQLNKGTKNDMCLVYFLLFPSIIINHIT